MVYCVSMFHVKYLILCKRYWHIFIACYTKLIIFDLAACCIGSVISVFIDHIAGEIIRLVESVCPSVCQWALSCLNHLTLIFGMRVDLDLC